MKIISNKNNRAEPHRNPFFVSRNLSLFHTFLGSQ
uniref:Uncharacterized protein n=1 Tax=Rhizophora mucronata TaxID=61149 RepID=A0A2P2QFV5_RHIMU